MVKRTEEKKLDERKEVNEKKKEIFKTWEDSYTAISKIWGDSLTLYRPLLEYTGDLFGKSFELSKDAAPEKYEEFYDQWVKKYQESSGKFYQIPSLESNKKTFEKLLVSAEESNKIYRLWIDELEENSRVTREVLQGEPDPAKYKEVYDLWIKSYGKAIDTFFENTPTISPFKEIPEPVKNAAKIYADTFTSTQGVKSQPDPVSAV